MKEAASLGGRAGLGRTGRRLSWLLPEEGLVLELLGLGAPSDPEPVPSALGSSSRSRERALAFSDFSFFLARVSHWISLWELKEGRECSLWVVEEEEKEEDEGVVERAPPSVLSAESGVSWVGGARRLVGDRTGGL